MVRLARVVAAGIPHHITQRGSRWQATCSGAEDDIEQDLVRAGFAARPWYYPWSSARAHVAGSDDALGKAVPLLKRVDHWEYFLSLETSEEEARRLRHYPGLRRELSRTVNPERRPAGRSRSPQGRIIHGPFVNDPG